jgi:GT2 family glycosyltransferase
LDAGRPHRPDPNQHTEECRLSSVDVIVPCYRYGRFLRKCVESVLLQSLREIRVLIIDDASPDDTVDIAAELAAEDSRVHVLRHDSNRGHIATYNEGIEWASADYMLILSADDYLLPGALSRASAVMDAHPDVGLTFGKAVELRSDAETPDPTYVLGSSDSGYWQVLDGPKFIESSAGRNMVPTPTALVRTALQKRLGGYRPDLPHSGDMEMWFRLAVHSRVAQLDAFQAVYRHHADNMSLAYTFNSWLPDLQQRKAALDALFQTCSNVLPDSVRLRQRLLRCVAFDAVGFGSRAFNGGSMDECECCAEFALQICPQIKRSWPWVKLAWKRRLGPRGWIAIQPLVMAVRRVLVCN